MDLRQEREFEMAATPAQVAERLQEWAHASGFVCTTDTPRRWVFTRGSSLQAFYSFDIRKIPTEAVVEIVTETPLAVRCGMRVKSALQLSTGGDHKRVSEQMDLLVAHLKGAL